MSATPFVANVNYDVGCRVKPNHEWDLIQSGSSVETLINEILKHPFGEIDLPPTNASAPETKQESVEL